MSAANADSAELAKAIPRFGEAWACGDVTVLETPLSRSYSHIDADGAFHDKASWLGYAGRRAGRTTRIAFRDLQTRLVGDTAIVTGINDVESIGDPQVGARQDLTLRLPQVWTWGEGRWLREAFQATISNAQ